VSGQLQTVSGDITVGAKSHVRGGIHVEKPHGISWGRVKTPRIVIGPNARVDGELRFDRTVELFVHPTATIGRVTGATAQSYSGALPPRRD
jgi:cytoskeletal protein CcmA (bactofilin family)